MKKFIIAISAIFILVSLLEIFQNDTMDNIKVTTTLYPITYIMERLYGEHAIVKSIYPEDTNIYNHVLTQKELIDYSKSNLFIFNGLSNEADYALTVLNNNSNLRIINAAMGMELNEAEQELWLSPYNFLMFAQNIKKGLNEYIVSPVLLKSINENYEEIKVEVSELDASIQIFAENAPNKTVVTTNKMFSFLDKYGLDVIIIKEDNTLDKTISDINKLIEKKALTTIFLIDDEEMNDEIIKLVNEKNIKIERLRSLSNITSKEVSNKDDYFSIMKNNWDLIKASLY